jgi:hypothetical protein
VRLGITTLVCLAFVALGGCSSSASTSTPSKTAGSTATGWDARGLASLDAARADLRRAFPGQCRNLDVYNHAEYVADNKILKTPVPAAVASCSVDTESLEMSAFRSAATRDAFIAERTARICARALSRRIPLAGLPWISTGTVSMQPDTQAGGQRIALATRSRFALRTCAR